ncbi:MAG: Gfo/Idh/MocA family oxidoreductase, partial [Candidatus Hydrogenedentes bacterium]|nr:Gfo/Idh/MocA family oxidoreductase [Candidatus Hydrogenedentota bacterium]
MPSNRLSRRTFITHTATAAGAFMIVPRRVLGGPNQTPPSERLRVAGIGAGGQAMHDLGQVSRDADIVALCDVDQEKAAKAHERWPDARQYTDWRAMLDKEQQEIDAVVVACPDHIHAPAAKAAMQLGKHVYVEKPMAHDVAEVRTLMKLAKETGVVTQMGNQGHSFPGCYRLKQWIQQGAIGPVREVMCWTNRPGWKQGIDRPTDTPPVPPTLDWDLWLGPAPYRPYNPIYCPRSWRGWWDFGTCALGDMGCHILDPVFFSLKLGAPTRVTAEAEGATAETGPLKSRITYEFPERGDGYPACKIVWHDG